nr:histidine kinase [Streptomyces sp. AJS327]
MDGLLAVVAFALILVGAATEPHGPDGQPGFGERELNAQTVLLAALACGVLVLRRRAPRRVLAVTCLVTVAGFALAPGTGAASERAPIVLAAAVALYTVADRTDRGTSWRLGAATVLVVTGAGMLFGARPWYAQENLGIFAWTGMAAAAGEAVRSRRAAVDAIRERAERAERTREEEARRRVAEERMRIARELHDVVAHHIALVNVQAGVASHVLDRRPDQAKQALAHVREASRHALAELQTTVGVLRQSGESTAPTEPAPGLDVLGDLLEGFTRAGLSVTLVDDAAVRETSEPSPGPPPSPDLPESAGPPEPEPRPEPAGRSGRSGGARTAGPATAVDPAGPTVPTPRRGSPETLPEPPSTGGGVPAGAPAGEQPLPSAVDLAAYRVVQEALTNVWKHAGGGAHAEVTILRDGAALEVIVEDDGAGAADSAGAAAARAPEGGHGLLGMRERATALGGECETGPLAGGGFRVRVRLPLDGPAGKGRRA